MRATAFRRACYAIPVAAASAATGLYAVEPRADEDELPRRWDAESMRDYWRRRPCAAAGRAFDIAATLGPVAAACVADRLTVGADEPAEARDARLRKRAVATRDALVSLGPAFIKLGQALSIRPDVVPAPALEVLRELCDACPAVPTAVALATLKDELGPTNFAALNLGATSKPVAAASLGQVYRTTTADGRDVAVKVQRPGVAAGVSLDLTLLGRWARFVEAVKGAVAPAQRPYDVSLVEAFSAGAWGELDYEREAENQRFMRAAVLDGPAAIRRGVVVPEVRAATRRALVTDWVEGDQLARAAPATIQKLVPLGVELFMFQLLDLGFYHCDPHPGNLLVDGQGRLALIDFGLCTTIGAQPRDALTKTIVHLIQGDVAALLDDAVELDFLPEDVDKTALYPVLERVFAGARLAAKQADAAAPVHKRRKEFAAVAGDLNDVFFSFPFSVPEYFALITRALIVLEGIALTGDPNFDIFKAAYPHGLRRAKEVFGAEGLARIAAAAAGEMATRRREARRHDDGRLRTRATM